MIILKYITHVLSKQSDKPILNDYEGKISNEIDKFMLDTIKKVAKDDLLRKAKFLNIDDKGKAKENIVKKCCDAIIHDERTFIENSKEIASYLFDIMKISPEMESCDLVICLYVVKDQTKVAIIKLDYKASYNHSIEFEDDKFNIQMKLNEEMISDSMKPKQCALIGVSSLNSEYDLYVLDKELEKDGNIGRFINKFLEVYRIEDDTYKTKKFINLSKVYLTNLYEGDIIEHDIALEILEHILLNNSVIDVFDIADRIFGDIEMRDDFIDYMEENDLSKFNIDTKLATKILKNRIFKTDSGIKVSARLEDIRDNMNFNIKRNDNGLCDLVIKNVKFVEVK